VREWIDWAAQRFDRAGLHYGHGTESSRDEASWLVLHAIGAPLQCEFLDWESIPGPEIAAKIECLVGARVEQRCPAAYLTGTAWFAGLEFEVSPDVLVPRSPIAELIRDGFEPWVNQNSIESILDLGTGSGCIAIACAVRFKNAQVDASDISQPALEVAGRNIRRHDLAERVHLIHSDLFDSLGGRKYDLIVSNPPYVPAASMTTLPDEFLAEPAMGLVSGMDGLEIPLRILETAASFLTSDGVLVCEVGESQERLQEALPQVPFLWLEFEAGGQGVFLLDHDQLGEAGPVAGKYLRDR
jgi:ribosomal protein L3 glutamine methyltransferase